MNRLFNVISYYLNEIPTFFGYLHSDVFSQLIASTTTKLVVFNIFEWAIIFFCVVISLMFLKKMGDGFLKGIEQMPFLIQLQKNTFILFQFLYSFALWLLIIACGILIMANAILFKSITKLLFLIKPLIIGGVTGWLFGYIFGKLLQQWIAKYVEPKYSSRIKKKKDSGIEVQSDIRDVVDIIARTKDYDPLRYFKNDKVFIGLDEIKHPIYIPSKVFRETHIQIMGCTGSGKSVAAVNILVQAIEQGYSAVMFDPKVGADEWAPHVLRMACKKFNKEFIIIDLQRPDPQINLLQDISQSELNELLQAGMGIEDKGGDGDYYRLKDRKAAKVAAHYAGRATSFGHLYYLMMNERTAYMEAADSFSDKLEMLASIPAVQTKTGINIREALENGICLYIVGAMRDQQVKMLQKMILLRIMQIIERRDRLSKHTHVSMFIDELKYFLTRPVLDGLSTVRDHECNMLLGHQGPGDLLDVSKDISGLACQNTVITNTNIKLIYKLNDDVDQRKAASLTGEKNVMRASIRQTTNMGVGEITNTDERQLMGVQENLYSHNYFSQLKKRVGIIVGLGLAKLCFTAPIAVKKQPLQYPSYDKEYDYINELHEQKDVSTVTAKTRSKPSAKEEVSSKNNAALPDRVDTYDELHTMNELEDHHSHHGLEDIR